jgi:hypothetical protein
MLHLLHVFQTPFHASLPYQGTRPKVDQIQSYAIAAEQQAKEDVICSNRVLAASASCLVLNWPSMIGVSMGPGLSVLTRIPRSFKSAAQLRANERMAALVAEYVT